MSTEDPIVFSPAPQLAGPDDPGLIHPAPGHGDDCWDLRPCAACALHHLDCICRRCAAVQAGEAQP